MAINKCDGCEKLNKRKKNSPCEMNFNCVFTNGIYKRPSKCKKKFIKVDPKKELKRYKEKAINAFQTYIKYRDNWECIVCGLKVDPKKSEQRKLMHAGHFLSRKFSQLLLDEKNCHAQCRNCNGKQDWLGVDPKYLKYILNKYGIEVLDYYIQKLEEKRDYTLEDWINISQYWENKLNEMKNSII